MIKVIIVWVIISTYPPSYDSTRVLIDNIADAQTCAAVKARLDQLNSETQQGQALTCMPVKKVIVK